VASLLGFQGDRRSTNVKRIPAVVYSGLTDCGTAHTLESDRPTREDVPKVMKTWNAFQIGQSNGAYSGRVVKFTHEGRAVRGVLDRSDQASGSQKVLLVVDGTPHFVCSYALVEVS
jgi:hypothetical protein